MPSVYTDYRRYAAEKEYAIPLPQEREFHDRAIQFTKHCVVATVTRLSAQLTFQTGASALAYW